MLDTPQLVLAGIFGLLIGSFLNVVIYRLPRGQSLVTPPSTCPGCATRIRAVAPATSPTRTGGLVAATAGMLWCSATQ